MGYRSRDHAGSHFAIKRYGLWQARHLNRRVKGGYHMTKFRKILAAFVIALATATAVTAPTPARAWWHGGWGWHAGWGGWHPAPGWRAGWGWGWRGGVYVGVPPVVVGAPVLAPPVAYAPGYRWIPGYYTPYGVWVPPRWGY
jgi:hypothetical protein